MGKFKLFCAFALFALCGSAGFAGEAPKTVAADYESLMICIWDEAPDTQNSTDTYGVKLGVLGSFGAPVYGAEAAVIAASSKTVSGFKGALAYTNGSCVKGVGLAPVNLVDNVDGVEIGVLNVAKKGGIQIGILNFMENGFLRFFPLINFSL